MEATFPAAAAPVAAAAAEPSLEKRPAWKPLAQASERAGDCARARAHPLAATSSGGEGKLFRSRLVAAFCSCCRRPVARCAKRLLALTVHAACHWLPVLAGERRGGRGAPCCRPSKFPSRERARGGLDWLNPGNRPSCLPFSVFNARPWNVEQRTAWLGEDIPTRGIFTLAVRIPAASDFTPSRP